MVKGTGVYILKFVQLLEEEEQNTWEVALVFQNKCQIMRFWPQLKDDFGSS